MSTFIIIVYLSEGTQSNYLNLKEYLQNAGCSKYIVSKDGVSFILPKGVYLIKTNRTIEYITETTHTLATKIDNMAQVLVIKAEDTKGLSWMNLPNA